MYYCPGSAKGFITSRMREIYRKYPPEAKKYTPRLKKQGLLAHWIGNTTTGCHAHNKEVMLGLWLGWLCGNLRQGVHMLVHLSASNTSSLAIAKIRYRATARSKGTFICARLDMQ